MRALTLAAFAGLASQVAAECANACSGAGECGPKDQCICYDGYTGTDCSQRVCPSGLAFVDIPNGDLNHDGVLGSSTTEKDVAYSKASWSKYPVPEYWPTMSYNGMTVAAKANEAHFYTECSGKGACDRSTGLCVCFDGYTGSACQRTACPNDCSGHGVCRTVGDIAAGGLNKKFVDSAAGVNSYTGVMMPVGYRLYDADKNQACVCDAGYGGVDCSLRECARGDDPLTHRPADCSGKACDNEVQTFVLPPTAGAQSYKIQFTDFDGVTWETDAFTVNTADTNDKNAAAVEAALEGLPNKIVGDVSVTSDKAFFGNSLYTVTFKALSGNVPEFKVVAQGTSSAPVYQPAQPLQVVDLGATGETDVAAAANNANARVAPTAVGKFRSYQLKGFAKAAAIDVVAGTDAVVIPAIQSKIAEAFTTASAAFSLTGGWDATVVPATRIAPVDVIYSRAAKKALVVAKANANDASAAKTLASNPFVLTINSKEYVGSVLSKDGVTEHSMCSNRGMCDFSTGVCACFPGYTGGACEVQSALAV